MELYVKEDNFFKFVEFIKENKNNLDRNDFVQYYNGSLKSNNIKVVDYLLKEYKYIIEESHINNSMNCLVEPEFKDMVKVFIDNDIGINDLFDKFIEHYLEKLSYMYTDKTTHTYMEYMIYLLNNINKPNLKHIQRLLNDGSKISNLKVVTNIIDVIILFGGNEVSCETELDKLLFVNRSSTKKQILEKLDTYMVDIIKRELDEDNINKIVNILRQKNKMQYITKIKEDFYVYNDTSNNWCFDNNNIQYIKQHHTNPLNGQIIPQYVLDNFLN
tara:strand:- start:107 stop:925 length:819 start_codon:yes stop_codon:yes gene_type:complete